MTEAEFTLSTLVQSCQRAVANAADTVSAKFANSRFVGRQLAELSLSRFLASDSRLFLLLGKSGSGKSNLLCHFALDSVRERPTTLIVDMWRWPPHEPLLEFALAPLKSATHESTTYAKWLQWLQNGLEAQDSRLVIVIDGLNEVSDPQAVRHALRSAIAATSSRLKFVVSARTDSFRLSLRDSFWSDYVFRDNQSLEDDVGGDPPPASTLAHGRFRDAGEARRRVIEASMRHYRRAAAEERMRLERSHAIEASFVIDDFDETEFEQAAEAYRVDAELVGDARSACHNPLILRFVTDVKKFTPGVIDEVFTAEVCRRFLNAKVTEAESRVGDTSRELLLRVLTELACQTYETRGGSPQICRAVTRDGASSTHAVAVEALVDEGVLQRQAGADNLTHKVTFVFDRVCSFVLADAVAEAGTPELVRALSELSRAGAATDLNVQLTSFLLSRLDELVAMGKYDAVAFRRLLRGFASASWCESEIARVLPEFVSLSRVEVIAFIEGAMPEGDAWEFVKKARVYTVTLARLSHMGHGELVLDAIERMLKARREKEPNEYLPVTWVIPIAAAADKDPKRMLSLLDRLCDFEGLFTTDTLLLKQDLTSIDALAALRADLRQFPVARIAAIKALVASDSVLHRAAAAGGVAQLASRPGAEYADLVRAVKTSDDEIVRAAFAVDLRASGSSANETLILTAKDLCEDKSSLVRSAVAIASVRLAQQSVPAGDQILRLILSDTSAAVRVAAGQALAESVERAPDDHEWRGAALDMLYVLLRDPPGTVREDLLRNLPILSRGAAIARLGLISRAAKDPDAAVSRIIIGGLARYVEMSRSESGDVDDTWDDILLAMEKHSDHKVRRMAALIACGLLDFRHDQPARTYAALLNDSDARVRLTALAAHAVSASATCDGLIRQAPVRNVPTAGVPFVTNWACQFAEAKLVSRDWFARAGTYWFLLGAGAAVLPIIVAIRVLFEHSRLLVAASGTALDPAVSVLPALLGASSCGLLFWLHRAHVLQEATGLLSIVWRESWWRVLVPLGGIVVACVLVATIPDANAIAVLVLTLSVLGFFALAAWEQVEQTPEYFSERHAARSVERAIVLLVGGVCAGLMAGELATAVTTEVFYPVCLTLASVVVALPARRRVSRKLALGAASGGAAVAAALVGVLLVQSPIATRLALPRWVLNVDASMNGQKWIAIAVLIIAVHFIRKVSDVFRATPLETVAGLPLLALGAAGVLDLRVVVVVWCLLHAKGMYDLYGDLQSLTTAREAATAVSLPLLFGMSVVLANVILQVGVSGVGSGLLASAAACVSAMLVCVLVLPDPREMTDRSWRLPARGMNAARGEVSDARTALRLAVLLGSIGLPMLMWGSRLVIGVLYLGAPSIGDSRRSANAMLVATLIVVGASDWESRSRHRTRTELLVLHVAAVAVAILCASVRGIREGGLVWLAMLLLLPVAQHIWRERLAPTTWSMPLAITVLPLLCSTAMQVTSSLVLGVLMSVGISYLLIRTGQHFGASGPAESG